MDRSKHINLPLGKIACLTAFSVSTLSGVIAGVDPFVIMLRAGLAAAVIGLAGYLSGRVLVEFLKTP